MAELINPLSGERTAPIVKRGRPAKNAPVYDDSGILILSSEERERVNDILDEIKHNGRKVEALLISTARNYFDMGEILDNAARKATCSMSASKYEELTGIPSRMVSNALKVYRKFCDNPEAIDGLSMREVAMLIGEKKGGEEKDGDGPVQYSLPDGQLENIGAEDFGLPTMSGVALEKYRVHTDLKSGKFFLLSRKDKIPIPMGSISVDQPKNDSMKVAYQQLMEQTQCLIERYYALIEQGGNE